MTDLDERREGDWLEDRARRAAADLTRVVARRALPPIDERSTRAHPFVRPALLGFVAATVLAGLVLLVGAPMIRPAEEPRRPDDFRYVVEGFPDGWKVSSVKDLGDGDAPELGNSKGIVLGVPGDLSGFAMWIYWWPHGSELESPAVKDAPPEFEDLSVPGVSAACQQPIWGGYECIIDAPIGNMQLDARHLTLEQLRAVVAGLRIAFGTVTVDPASLPDGVVQLASGRLYLDPSYLFDPRSYSSIAYAPATTNTSPPTNALLIVSPDEGLDVATIAMQGDWKPAKVNGLPAFTYRLDLGSVVSQAVFWSDGSHRFLLSARNLDVDIVQLAEHVRPATAAEWHQG